MFCEEAGQSEKTWNDPIAPKEETVVRQQPQRHMRTLLPGPGKFKSLGHSFLERSIYTQSLIKQIVSAILNYDWEDRFLKIS